MYVFSVSMYACMYAFMFLLKLLIFVRMLMIIEIMIAMKLTMSTLIVFSAHCKFYNTHISIIASIAATTTSIVANTALTYNHNGKQKYSQTKFDV